MEFIIYKQNISRKESFWISFFSCCNSCC